jgi:hypothetical protein
MKNDDTQLVPIAKDDSRARVHGPLRVKWNSIGGSLSFAFRIEFKTGSPPSNNQLCQFMKSKRERFVCGFTFVVLVLGVLQADSAVLPDNPYGTIVARNIFGLETMPTNTPADVQPDNPPPKITPNGLMSIFGQSQVLFKVAAPPEAGQPPGEESYVMSVGDRRDEIEVIGIDEKAGIITFNNHGKIQELPLVSVASLAVLTAPMGNSAGAGVVGSSLPIPSGGRAVRFGDRSTRHALEQGNGKGK